MKDFNIAIEEYNAICDRIANIFVLKYFDKDADCWWLADEVGGVTFINDYFFSMSDILEYMKYGYSKKMMFERYEYTIDCIYKDISPTNIKNYKKLK